MRRVLNVLRLAAAVSLLVANGMLFAATPARAYDYPGQCVMHWPGYCTCELPVTTENCERWESSSCDWSPLCHPT